MATDVTFRPRLSRTKLNQCAWLFASAAFGYPIVGNLISLMELDSRVLSIPFRVAVCIFSATVMIGSRGREIDWVRRLMLLIWVLYISRLLHDWLVPHLEGADYALQFFLASCVFPAVALMRANQYSNRRFASIGFLVASLGALMSLVAALLGNPNVNDVGGTSRLFLGAIDPVSLGNQAVSALLCGAVLWRGSSLSVRLFLACIFLLLLWCLVLTGSKGPALALVVCLGLWAIRGGWGWKFALLALPLLALLALSDQSPLVARVAGSGDDESTLTRVVVLNDSLHQIASAPLIGSAFVEYNSGYYPHDVFIEAALALGIPIAIVFFILLTIGARRAWRTLNSHSDLLGLIYFQGLFAAAISSSIYGSILLWITLAMLPAVTPQKRAMSFLPVNPRVAFRSAVRSERSR